MLHPAFHRRLLAVLAAALLGGVAAGPAVGVAGRHDQGPVGGQRGHPLKG